MLSLEGCAKAQNLHVKSPQLFFPKLYISIIKKRKGNKKKCRNSPIDCEFWKSLDMHDPYAHCFLNQSASDMIYRLDD